MAKIPVKSVESDFIKEKSIYMRTIEVLYGIKIVGGNMFLNSTLRNHPSVRDFMLNYLKNDIIDLEREILKLLEEN